MFIPESERMAEYAAGYKRLNLEDCGVIHKGIVPLQKGRLSR